MSFARTSSRAIAAAVAALIRLRVSGGCGLPVFQGLRPLMAAEMRARRRRSASGVAAVPLRRRKEGERGAAAAAASEVEVEAPSFSSPPESDSEPDCSPLLSSRVIRCRESWEVADSSEEEEEEVAKVPVVVVVVVVVFSAVADADAATRSAAAADGRCEIRLAGRLPRLRLKVNV